MTLLELLGALVVAAGAWFIWDSLKVREAANTAMRAACREHGMLFLDDTVALRSLGVVRDDEGRARLRRVYAFEYSVTGQERHKGGITMIAERVDSVEI